MHHTTKLYGVFWVVIITFLVICNVSAWANKLFTFQFDNCSLKEALLKISSTCDLRINGPFTEMIDIQINESYTDSNIVKIIQDIFSGQDYAIEWRYQNKTLKQINILMVNGDKDNYNGLRQVPKHLSKQNEDIEIVDRESEREIQQEEFIKNKSSRVIHKRDYDIPPSPDASRFHGLETPPMPPGLPEIPSNQTTQ